MKLATPLTALAVVALVTFAIPGCINNEDAKPEWTYSVCSDICGSGSSGGQQGGSGSGSLSGGSDGGQSGGQLAGQNTACGTLAGQCGCTLGPDLFCGQCASAAVSQQCAYCPSGTVCSPDPCTPGCTVPLSSPPQPMPVSCVSDCGGGRCCPGDYPVCCSNTNYCGVSAAACSGAGTLPSSSNGGSGSGTNGSSGGSGSGGSGSGGGTCPCLASDAPQYSSCMNGDEAACYCAAAWLDNCGIQNAAAGCCNAGEQAACVSQLQSDCATQAQNAVALASPGVDPECMPGDFSACQ